MKDSDRRDVRAIVRTYKDKETGEDKNVYLTVGTAWVSPHASTITIQLDTLPISKDFNGKLYINKPYEPKSTESKDSLPDIDDKPINLSDIPF